jgi:hypothetical protein
MIDVVVLWVGVMLAWKPRHQAKVHGHSESCFNATKLQLLVMILAAHMLQQDVNAAVATFQQQVWMLPNTLRTCNSRVAK